MRSVSLPHLYTAAFLIFLATPTWTGGITTNFCSLATYGFYCSLSSVFLRFGECTPVFRAVLLTPVGAHSELVVYVCQFNLIKIGQRFSFDALGHADKHLVRLAFVFIQRILLSVAT